MFDVEVYFRFACPHCEAEIKRRFSDYLKNRFSTCGNCGQEVTHLVRVQDTVGESVDLEELSALVARLEGDWSSLLNENFLHDSKVWEDPTEEE